MEVRLSKTLRRACLVALAPVVLLIMATTSASAATVTSAEDGRSDAPRAKSRRQQQRFIGTYAVKMPGGRDATMTLRVFEQGDTLFGQINHNEPTRLLFVREGVFRPEAASGFSIMFDLDGEQSSLVTVESPDGRMRGVRVERASVPAAESHSADQVTSGPLYEALLRADSALFEAAFVTCDSAAVHSFLAEDVEFYHDQTGASFGKHVREDFERLTANCPGKHGVRRELVAGSLQVFPMKGDYAIQMGVHRFVQAGQPTATVARFVHLWKRKGEVWQLARVLSFDHRTASVK